MAFAVVVEQADGKFYTAVSGRASGFASSTKAELTGLLAAILASPRDKTVTIKIDNMAVVTQFQTLVKQRPFCTERQKLRSPYSVWWAAVYNAYIHQGSKVSVSWVRGHQGNKGNEAADKAAKSAHNGVVWEWDASKHNDMPCHAYFNNTTVETTCDNC
ncbi:MAG: ribonuclease H-like domain-containing protein [Benniella sp.]|nr:MAG: ribonuclease H-like domain-containing protein [Benniella sp.]